MNSYRKIFDLLSPSGRKQALFVLGLMMVGMVLETLSVGIVVPLTALLIHGDLGARYPNLIPTLNALGNPTQAQLVTWAMLALVTAYLIKNIFLAFLIWRETRFTLQVQIELSERLFSFYLRQPYSFHLQRNSAELIRNINTEVNLFCTRAVTPGQRAISESLVLIGVITLLLIIEPLVTVVVAGGLGISALAFYRAMRKRVTVWGKRRQYHEGLRIKHLQQGLGGVKDVKLLGRENEFLAQFRVHLVKGIGAAQSQHAFEQFPRLGLELLAIIGLAAMVSLLIAQGRDTPSIVSTMGLFAAAAFRLLPSVNRLLSAVQSMRFGLPIIELLHRELIALAPPPSPKADGADPALQLKRAIDVDDVSYSYEGSSIPAVESVSLKIASGQCVGLVGRSGSGKSTLLDVILGLLSPDSGRVRLDGQDIQSCLRAWQNQIGYVSQTIYLNDDTLRRNIAFGLAEEEINNDAVMRAVAAAQLEEFVAGLPDGVETVVGERGVRLSGGQRQRIGIARALYHDPSILVLDEATSALDVETESGVMRAVAALHGQKTILMVAHRLTTVQLCDRIFVMNKGRVVAAGSYEEILPLVSATDHISGASDA